MCWNLVQRVRAHACKWVCINISGCTFTVLVPADKNSTYSRAVFRSLIVALYLESLTSLETIVNTTDLQFRSRSHPYIKNLHNVPTERLAEVCSCALTWMCHQVFAVNQSNQSLTLQWRSLCNHRNRMKPPCSSLSLCLSPSLLQLNLLSSSVSRKYND